MIHITLKLFLIYLDYLFVLLHNIQLFLLLLPQLLLRRFCESFNQLLFQSCFIYLLFFLFILFHERLRPREYLGWWRSSSKIIFLDRWDLFLFWLRGKAWASFERWRELGLTLIFHGPVFVLLNSILLVLQWYPLVEQSLHVFIQHIHDLIHIRWNGIHYILNRALPL